MASANWLLEETMEGVTPEVFRWQPPGTAESIADNYLHTVVGADQFVHAVLLNTSPLVAGAMAGKTGLSSIPGGAHGSEGWTEWVKTVQVDLPAFRSYAKAVQAAIDGYLAGLKAEDLDRPLDLASYGLGVQTINWAVYNFLIGHAAQHTGEISAIKGCQKLKGYPF
jgi:hypothetical protein